MPEDWDLQPGMTLAIEPGLYFEGWGGIRVEDNVVINDAGQAEFLSTVDRSL
jgi:Xaa-Pro dipeptidase